VEGERGARGGKSCSPPARAALPRWWAGGEGGGGKERKKENRQRGIGEEDRVPTCTSRILEGRPGAQANNKVENGKILFRTTLGTGLARTGTNILFASQSRAQCCAMEFVKILFRLHGVHTPAPLAPLVLVVSS